VQPSLEGVHDVHPGAAPALQRAPRALQLLAQSLVPQVRRRHRSCREPKRTVATAAAAVAATAQAQPPLLPQPVELRPCRPQLLLSYLSQQRRRRC
jgi:hypothetical protein